VPTGEIIVVSAPSGTGKTTLIRRLLAEVEGIRFSVSHTTRNPRPGETDGVDYHFVDRARFDAMVAKGEFLEWAEVYAHLYGTAISEVEGPLASGEDVLLDVDTQGARSVRARRPESVLIFILPPGVQALAARIASRGQDGPEQMARRVETAGYEVAALDMYDYCVVNDTVERALGDLKAIVRACRLRRHRAPETVLKIVREFGKAGPSPAP